MKLTVIINNIAPFIHLQEPVQHRSVRIELTEEQKKMLRMKWVARSGATDYYEEISHCFLEGSPQKVEHKEATP